MLADALKDVSMEDQTTEVEDVPPVMPDASALMDDDTEVVIEGDAGEARHSTRHNKYDAGSHYPSYNPSYYDPYESHLHTPPHPVSQDCPYCDCYGGEDAYYSHCDHKCSCMESPSLADIHILKPSCGYHDGNSERITNHMDNI